MDKFQEVADEVLAWCNEHQKATAVIAALLIGLIAGAVAAW